MDVLAPYPWLLPGIAISLGLGAVAAAPVGHLVRINPKLLFLLIASVGLIVAATLTPGGEAPRVTPGTCDTSRLGLAPLRQLLRVSDATSNVALFLPLGVVIAMLPRRRLRASATGAGLVAPVGIELVQWLVVPLGRACQTGDAVDNVCGLLVGLVIGLGLSRLGGRAT